MAKTEKPPTEVQVKISLENTVHFPKGGVVSFSPDQNNLDHRAFLTGNNARALSLFTSGADIVFYDRRIKYVKMADEAFFEQEYGIAVRSLVYQLNP